MIHKESGEDGYGLGTRNAEPGKEKERRASLANVWRVVAVRFYREGHADPLKEFTEACREEQKSMLKNL